MERTYKHVVALLSNQGTACDETALCDDEDTPANRARVERLTEYARKAHYSDAPQLGTWTVVTDNDSINPTTA